MNDAIRPDRGVESPADLVTGRIKQVSAEQMFQAERSYLGIETSFHYRLDGIVGEDKSPVRHPTSALNLAVIRRCVLSLAAQ